MTTIEFLRQFRVGDFAIFDFAAAFLGIYLASSFLSRIFLKIKIKIPKRNWVFLTLPIAIIIHLLIGNITPMTRDFLDIGGHYVLKLVIIVSLVCGLWGIKRVGNK